MSTNQEYAKRSTGGDGYYLAADEIYEANDNGKTLVMNIDWIGVDNVTFTQLVGIDKNDNAVDLLDTDVDPPFDTRGRMGIDGIALTAIRNFTWGKGFKTVQADVPIWLNLNNKY
jgi:hypothetical protein